MIHCTSTATPCCTSNPNMISSLKNQVFNVEARGSILSNGITWLGSHWNVPCTCARRAFPTKSSKKHLLEVLVCTRAFKTWIPEGICAKRNRAHLYYVERKRKRERHKEGERDRRKEAFTKTYTIDFLAGITPSEYNYKRGILVPKWGHLFLNVIFGSVCCLG